MKICIKSIFFLLVFNILLTGCITKSISKKGFIFDDEDIANITVGVTNKDNVIKYLGYPLDRSYFNSNMWIYYSYETKEVLFFKPKIQNQKMLIIEFDNKTELVSNLLRYNIDSNKIDINDIKLKDDYNKNLLKDIITNIGQVGIAQ